MQIKVVRARKEKAGHNEQKLIKLCNSVARSNRKKKATFKHLEADLRRNVTDMEMEFHEDNREINIDVTVSNEAQEIYLRDNDDDAHVATIKYISW